MALRNQSGIRRVRVVARGPKTVAALKELGVPVDLAVPEPNTWREVLDTLDHGLSQPISGRLRIAVQEYGIPNSALLAGLKERGARVIQVRVYQWALPEDTTILREAVRALAGNELDVVLFTTSVQVTHLFRVVAEMDLEEPLRRELQRCVISSIGPTHFGGAASPRFQRGYSGLPPENGLAGEANLRAL